LQLTSHFWFAQIFRISRGNCFFFHENLPKPPSQIQYPTQVSLVHSGKLVLLGLYVKQKVFSISYLVYVSSRILFTSSQSLLFTNKTFPTSHSGSVSLGNTIRKHAELHVAQHIDVQALWDLGLSSRGITLRLTCYTRRKLAPLCCSILWNCRTTLFHTNKLPTSHSRVVNLNIALFCIWKLRLRTTANASSINT
jgi:hypothetical protein